MLKKYFSKSYSLIIYANDCTIKYLLISKNKKRFTPHEEGSLNSKCKTALQKLSTWSKKHPTTVIFPSYKGVFSSTTLAKQPPGYIEKKIEKEFLETSFKTKTWQGPRTKTTPYSIPQKEIDDLLSFFGSISLCIDDITPSFFGVYQYLLSNHLGEKSTTWCFTYQDELTFLQVKKKHLVDGFSIPFSSKEFFPTLLKALYALKERRNWSMKHIGWLGEAPLASLKEVSEKTGCSFFSPKQASPSLFKDPILPLQLTLSHPFSLFFPLSFSSTLNLSRGFFKKKQKELSLFSLLLALGLVLQVTAWVKIQKNQKQVNLKLFETLYQNNPLAFPSPSSFHSTEQDLDLLKKSFAKLQENSIKYADSTSIPPLTSLFIWLTAVKGKLKQIDNKSELKLKSLRYENNSLQGKQGKVSLVFTGLSSQTTPALKKIIQESKLIDQPKDLSSSFKNNEYKASFYLKEFSPKTSIRLCSEP